MGTCTRVADETRRAHHRQLRGAAFVRTRRRRGGDLEDSPRGPLEARAERLLLFYYAHAPPASALRKPGSSSRRCSGPASDQGPIGASSHRYTLDRARIARGVERKPAIRVITLVSVLVRVAVGMIGCATPQEWAEWKGHPVHFTSGDHVGFSVRNRDGPQTREARDDVALARRTGSARRSPLIRAPLSRSD